MPTLPMIVPIIIVGGLVGSLLKSRKPKIPWKRTLLWSIIAGLLNAAYAYAELILTPQPTTTFRGAAFVAQVSPIVFTVGSFLAAFLIVIVIFGVAAIFLRLRGGDMEPEEETETELAEEESKLKPG